MLTLQRILKIHDGSLSNVDNELLRRKAKVCTHDEVLDFVINEKTAVGLSAPQIGFNKRVVITFFNRLITKTFINPTFVPLSDRMVVGEEGDLSLPGKTVNISRYDLIRVQYNKFYPRTGCMSEEVFKDDFSGFHARILQHEIDHLNGILITDYCK